jgi:NitT/TauT family transport system substrate-binding protein
VISSNFESGKIDAGFLVMARELLDERPDVAEAWMKAELDAKRYLADPANAGEIAAQTGGMR